MRHLDQPKTLAYWERKEVIEDPEPHCQTDSKSDGAKFVEDTNSYPSESGDKNKCDFQTKHQRNLLQEGLGWILVSLMILTGVFFLFRCSSAPFSDFLSVAVWGVGYGKYSLVFLAGSSFFIWLFANFFLLGAGKIFLSFRGKTTFSRTADVVLFFARLALPVFALSVLPWKGGGFFTGAFGCVLYLVFLYFCVWGVVIRE
ncbi:MAG: hypothetical protein AB1700_00730 [Bacillota bacterium]